MVVASDGVAHNEVLVQVIELSICLLHVAPESREGEGENKCRQIDSTCAHLYAMHMCAHTDIHVHVYHNMYTHVHDVTRGIKPSIHVTLSY